MDSPIAATLFSDIRDRQGDHIFENAMAELLDEGTVQFSKSC